MAKRKRGSNLADNRRAKRQYEFLENFEAGIVLSGAEVKSCRAGRVHLADAYAGVNNGELWLHNVHISPYTHATIGNTEPVRRRKLLMHRREIDRIDRKIRTKGLTLVPTRVYTSNGRIKFEIALARGRRAYDKRDEKRQAIEKSEAREALARRRGRK